MDPERDRRPSPRRRLGLSVAASLVALLGLALVGPAERSGLAWESRRVRVAVPGDEPTVEAVFRYENRGPDPVVITDIRSTCGCTVPSLQEGDVVPPGVAGELRAVVTLGQRTGRFVKHVDLETTDARDPTVRLSVEVEVPERIRPSQRVARWSLDAPPDPQEIGLQVVAPDPIAIASARAVDDRFHVTLEAREPGRRYTVRVVPRSTAEPVRDVIELRTAPETRPLRLVARVVGR